MTVDRGDQWLASLPARRHRNRLVRCRGGRRSPAATSFRSARWNTGPSWASTPAQISSSASSRSMAASIASAIAGLIALRASTRSSRMMPTRPSASKRITLSSSVAAGAGACSGVGAAAELIWLQQAPQRRLAGRRGVGRPLPFLDPRLRPAGASIPERRQLRHPAGRVSASPS